MISPPSRRPWLLYGLGGGVGTLLTAMLFLGGLAMRERDNRFCVACHLHEAKFTRMVGPSATDLAGSHHRKDARVGCIACHGGADPLMRVRVWSIAGMDTLKFLAGTYGEPTHMRLPVRDRECRRCHTPIVPDSPAVAGADGALTGEALTGAEASYMAEAPVERAGRVSFHGFPDHDTVDVRCVACHTAHTTGSTAVDRFVAGPVVEPICRRCHRPQ